MFQTCVGVGLKMAHKTRGAWEVGSSLPRGVRLREGAIEVLFLFHASLKACLYSRTRNGSVCPICSDICHKTALLASLYRVQ